jgi:hypothetical protein
MAALVGCCITVVVQWVDGELEVESVVDLGTDGVVIPAFVFGFLGLTVFIANANLIALHIYLGYKGLTTVKFIRERRNRKKAANAVSDG